MEKENKGAHVLVVYLNTGEHIMLGYDKLEEDLNKGRIEIYRFKEEAGIEYKDWIATFYHENIAGWETIK